MIAFWKFLIQGMLEAIGPRVIVEVGAGGVGRNTKNLLEFAKRHGGVVHVIDPSPRFDVEEWQRSYGEALVFHPGEGLSALAGIESPDAVLMDDDANWFTVHRELGLLREAAERADRPFPLTFVRNVSWPYARRDTYRRPEAVPEELRHPHRKAGIVFGEAELSVERGINAGRWNAETEGTPRNGVLTAVEDFVGESAIAFAFHVVHGYSGLGILAPQLSLAERPALRAAFERLMAPDFLYQHTKRLERAHSVLHQSFTEQKRELREATSKLGRLEARPAGAPRAGVAPRTAAGHRPATGRHAASPPSPRALRVAFVGSERLGTLLAPSCDMTLLTPRGWAPKLTEPRPDLLLIETVTDREPGPWPYDAVTTEGGALVELLGWCRQHQVPSALWATLDGASLAPFIHVARLCDHHFVADAEGPGVLAGMIATDVPPGVLPLAAQPALHRPGDDGDRDGGPLYVGGWRQDWSASALRVLAMLLHAARPHGLRIAVPPGADADFPAIFEDRVELVPDLPREIELMQQAPVVIAFHPAVSARTFVPRVAFEAPACGAAVIAWPNWGMQHHFADTVASAKTPDEASDQLELLLADASARRRRVGLARQFLEYGHTYDHRLATIASRLGLCRVPEPPALRPLG